MGFGIAFFVLFRHDINNDEDIKENFERVDRALFTMFGMMLGEFEISWFYNSRLAVPALVLFVLYMISMMIVLLNLLIAIMSDTFDRVKDVEEVAFLHARATVIDDVESMLSNNKKKELG